MSISANAQWRGFAKTWLERLGLLGPAFRAWEALRAIDRRYSRELYKKGVGPDGLPVPPPRLVVGVGGHNNVDAFVEGGRLLARRIESLLERHSVEVEDLSAILDFGCGSGRIIRQWKFLETPALFGCDYNAEAVAWCAANLSHARFTVNGPMPPLPYETASFDLVYAFSVFTHFTEPMQFAWIQEMARVIRPDGHLIISVHGPTWSTALAATECETFNRGQLVVRYASVAGTNLCAAFHPMPFIHQMTQPHFELLELHSQHGDQDLLLMRRLHD
jgi:SAM-dependent methyltransferase